MTSAWLREGDFSAELAFSHPRERYANSPVGFCSEQPAVAG